MASEPYIRRNPNDIITSQDWNDIQSQAKDEIRGHKHDGLIGDQQIPRGGIQNNAIDGTKIDPASTVTVGSLTVSSTFKVGARTLLAEIDTLHSSKLSLTGGTLTGALTVQGALTTGGALTVSGTVTANRFTSNNALVLNDYQTVNPSSNVYLDAPPGDRDAWLFRDQTDATTNWGVYYRQINTLVKNLPANSIGFIGGGDSSLKAYIGLSDGAGFFAGPLTVRGVVTASRFTSDNALALTDYQVVNPTSNVYLQSTPNDRDAWVFRDIADASSNWGIYHRQIDSTVKNLPGNSIGFIGGGTSSLQAYISLWTGAGYFAGNLGVGAAAPETKLDVRVPGISGWDRFQVTTTSLWGDGATQFVTLRGSTGLMIPNLHIPWFDNRASIRYGRSGGVSTGRWWDAGVRGNNAFSIMDDASDHKLWLALDGMVGVGTTSPDAPIHIRQRDARGIRLDDHSIAGRFFRIFFETGNGTVVFYHQGGTGQFMRQDGAWQQNSDASLKENVVELSGVLDKVLGLRPVSFDWKVNKLSNIGFIAQDVEPLFPELVSETQSPEGGKLKGLPYSTFGVLAIAALKELKASYDARLTELEARLAALESR